MITRVLINLSDKALQKKLKNHLQQSDIIIETLKDTDAAWRRINQETFDLVVLDPDMVPEPADEMIGSLRDIPDSPSLVLITPRNDPEQRAGLLASGCDEVLFSGISVKALTEVFNSVLDKRRELAQQGLVPYRMTDQPRLNDFVSRSPVMQTFMDVVRRIVPSNSSLLILGETGVGKERLARAIHAEGPRDEGPFIAVNCGALPESLLESELFGHEKGAFTGAIRSRRGCFELAHGGTIFLDEIGEMPLHLQVKLLRFLQEQEIQRIGSERVIRVDSRVMAATNRDLQEDVARGLFRKDLFYRLGVISLTVPPLRERREDIRELVFGYIDYLRPRVGQEVDSITDEAVAAMENYEWPGNVRELINVIERAMLLCSDQEITLKDLPDVIRGDAGTPVFADTADESTQSDFSIPDAWLDTPLKTIKKQITDQFEKAYLAGLLTRNRGKIGASAEQAGITPRALYEKMKRHGLEKEDFKKDD